MYQLVQEGTGREEAAMGRQEISERAHSSAPPAVVYALLRAGATWPTWSPLGAFELRQEGRDGGESLDAVRVFRTGRTTTVERIVELVPDRRFSYELISGIPIRGYRADVDLTPASDGGTDIHWHSSFTAKLPGTGRWIRRTLARFIGETVRGLAAGAAGPVGAAVARARDSQPTPS
jgi:hypothetical protein